MAVVATERLNGASLVEFAAHLPQLSIEGVRGVLQDDLDVVLNLPLSYCHQIVEMKTDH